MLFCKDFAGVVEDVATVVAVEGMVTVADIAISVGVVVVVVV